MSLVSEKRGKRVLGRFISLSITLLVTVTPSISNQKSESEGVYYSKNEDITKGNSHYNNTGNVKTVGVAVRTGSISGTVNGPHETISVQDSVNSSSRGYSVSLGIGIGPHTEKRKAVNGPYISSATVGYNKGDVNQKITRNVAEFTAGSGMLDVKGKIVQVGSLIDGGFTLNGQGYEKQDLHDIDKSRKVGVNVTVYPNVTYTKRDEKGNAIYIDGRKENEQGAVYKVGVNYAEMDKARDVLSTVGSNVQINQDITGVNRDTNRQAGEFEGREINPINVDLGTEYWLTRAGRGKAKDIFEDAGRSVEGIKRILTTRDADGNLQILKSIEAETAVQKMMRIGFIETKGKTQQQVKKELEERFGSLTKKGVKVHFYGTEDIDTSKMDDDTLAKLVSNGFAITKDGTVWINKEYVDSGKVIDFNKTTQHEISHLIFGEDSEYQAQYLTRAYGEFLEGIRDNGYLKDGQGIIDYKFSMLTDEDRLRLDGYTDEEMQFFLHGFMQGIGLGKQYEDFKGKVKGALIKKENELRNIAAKSYLPKSVKNGAAGAASMVRKVSKGLTAVSKADKKFYDREGKNLGIGVKKGKISTTNFEKSLKYVGQSFSVVKKENKNKGAVNAIKKVNKFEKYDDLDAYEKESIIDNILLQAEENERKGGIKYSEKLFTEKRIGDFINKPEQRATKIEYQYEGMLWDDAVMAGIDAYSGGPHIYNKYVGESIPNTNNKEHYKRLWDTEVGKIYKAPSGREFLVIDTKSTISGMNAITVKDVVSGRSQIVFQGSVPGIGEPLKNPISYVQDWGNNSVNAEAIRRNNINMNFKFMGTSVNITPRSLIIRQNDNITNAFYLKRRNNSIFKGDEIGRNQQYEDAYNYTKKIMKDPRVMGTLTKTKGHSLGGGPSEETGSRLDLESIVIDPAPVNNPGKYIDDGRTLVLIPNHGKAMLNKKIIDNKGRATYKFAPLGLPNLGVGRDVRGVAIYDNMGADGDNIHEPNYDDIRKNEAEMKSFFMPVGPVR
ncbi:hypothetical protein [Pseudoleptotrichia goodfellowii]|uniref:Uncharacterized protein n=1 Tax=Pseudoleptotrichia goodfellowii TaxID=157692 RepID=A0A510JG24_9FUSO|nr:hypothetical protein [Pseudoleptotrichia goodfellowii]BBM36903.1 hypothetical protein JCM16774_1849 [Pseudoleptotrichia goodfellowii]